MYYISYIYILKHYIELYYYVYTHTHSKTHIIKFSYLPGWGNTMILNILNWFFRVMLIHSTGDMLNSVISPNSRNSTALFVIMGNYVKALPCYREQ